MMNFTKALLVVAAGLILATQAQAEILGFDETFTMSDWMIAGPPTDVTAYYQMEDFDINLVFVNDEENDLLWAPYSGSAHNGDGMGAQTGPGANWCEAYVRSGYVDYDTNAGLATITLESVWSENNDDTVGTQITIDGLLGGSGGAVQWTYTNTAGGDWEECTAGAGIPIDTFRAHNVGDGSVDDFDLTPEPATLALLGLGGLGLLVRRKRR